MKHYLLATEASPELSELYRLTLGFLDRHLQLAADKRRASLADGR